MLGVRSASSGGAHVQVWAEKVERGCEEVQERRANETMAAAGDVFGKALHSTDAW